jgi:hypothetical protein
MKLLCFSYRFIRVVDVFSIEVSPRDAGVSWRPKRGGFEEEPGCGGYPTAMTRRKVKGELWAGVTPSGRSPVTWIPMKRDPEGSEAKGRGLDIA